MTLYLLVFCALLAFGFVGLPKRYCQRNEGLLSRNATACVNGYFILVIFLSHMRTYISADAYGPLDTGFLAYISFLSQLVVATFLFFSGYGIMESIRHKEGYVIHMPRRRILPFLLDVWLAIAVYLVLAIARGSVPTLSSVLLSMVGWKNLGNSSWYIFAILCMWIATYAAFRLFPYNGHGWRGVALVTVLTLAYALLMRHEGVSKCFYDTILCYPAGMALSCSSEQVDHLLFRSKYKHVLWVTCFAALLAAFLALHTVRTQSAIYHNAMSVAFSLLVVLILSRVPYTSKPLAWAGSNLFFLYIYQRVPMILLTPVLAAGGVFAYVTACAAAFVPFCLAMKAVNSKWKGLFL